LLGIQDVEDRASANALFGACPFERELIGLDRDALSLDLPFRGLVIGEGGARGLDYRPLGPDQSFERFALQCLRLANSRGRQPALKDREARAETDRRFISRVRKAARAVARKIAD